MNRIAILAALAAAALAACQQPEKPVASKSGPAVAKGDGVVITADEFKARLEEQSPFVRQRFTTVERKKEFLDNLVRFEVLAREAERQGLQNDPDVQLMMKRVMVQKLVQKSFASEADAAKKVSDAEVQQHYDSHKDEYHRPAKVRVSHVLVKAPAAGPEREKAEAAAKKLVARVRAEEKKAPGAFATIARDASQDDATKAVGGDLGFRTKDELAAQLSPQAAEAALALKDGETSEVVASPNGFHVLKRTGWQDAVDRPLDAVKAQIATRLAKERRTKDFDEFVKGLTQKANVKVDEKELEKVTVTAGAPGAPSGMGGMGGMSPHGAMGGSPAAGGPAAPRP
jgi:peptidyl-prolyl cis-trans isomerase C